MNGLRANERVGFAAARKSATGPQRRFTAPQGTSPMECKPDGGLLKGSAGVDSLAICQPFEHILIRFIVAIGAELVLEGPS